MAIFLLHAMNKRHVIWKLRFHIFHWYKCHHCTTKTHWASSQERATNNFTLRSHNYICLPFEVSKVVFKGITMLLKVNAMSLCHFEMRCIIALITRLFIYSFLLWKILIHSGLVIFESEAWKIGPVFKRLSSKRKGYSEY